MPLLQALSGDFQCACGKMHAQILLGVRWCVMSIFLFLKLYNFNKGIICTEYELAVRTLQNAKVF